MSMIQSRIERYEETYGQVPPGRRMTEAEFDAWIGEKTRAEWVDGEVEMMAAAVSIEHDDIAGWLRMVVKLYADHFDLGSVHGPEVLARLRRVRRKRLPDVIFVAKARAEIVQEKEIDGSPDLIMEVVSPDSAERDWFRKYADYERAGVREYWIIDPLADMVEAYKLLRTGKYRRIGLRDGKIVSRTLRGFYLRPEWVLSGRTPGALAVLSELGVRG